MAILCKKIKLIYVQVPGTGCSVVSVALKRQFDGSQLGRKHNTTVELLDKELISETQLEQYLVVANVRNPFDRMATYFQRYKGNWYTEESLRVQEQSLTREIDRGALSERQKLQRAENLEKARSRALRRARIFRFIGFNTWLLATVLRWQFHHKKQAKTQDKFAQMFPMLEQVDVVLRQETLEESLNLLLQKLNIAQDVDLPRKNLTPEKKHYTQYYNLASRWLMKRVYGKELAKMGYIFGGADGDLAPIALTPKGKRFLH